VTSHRSISLLALTAFVGLAVPATAPAAAHHHRAPAALPRIKAVSPLAAAQPGARVAVRVTLAGRSGRTHLSFLLSPKPRPGGSARRLGSGATVPAVKQGHSLQITRTIVIPRRTKIAHWYLLACVGSGRPSRCASAGLPVLAPPSPRNISVQTDGAHAASARIAAATGGTVTATGADGSTYALTLPPNALTSDETITLTPVSSLAGLKAGSPAAGVQIAPDGLSLLAPGRLTITPAKAVPVARQIAYFWHGIGQGSGLYAPNPDPKSFTLTLDHFSGYELVDGSAADRAALANQPVAVQDRYADLAAAAAAARDAGDSGAAAARFQAALIAFYKTQYEAVVKPALDAAAGDDTLANSALQLGLSWAHDVAALGAGFDAETRSVMSQMAAILDNALVRSAQRCTTDVAFTQRVLYLAHLRAVLGVGDAATAGDFAKAQRCLQFVLDFTATTADSQHYFYGSDVQLKGLKISALGPDTANQVNAPAPVSGTVQYTRLTESGGCPVSWEPSQELKPFTVYRLEIDSTLREVVDAAGHTTFQSPPPSVGLIMSPGMYQEHYSRSCPGSNSPPTEETDMMFTGDFMILHQDEVNLLPNTVAFELLGWTPGSNGVLAQKTYDQTWSDGQVSDRQQSTFTLRYDAGG
jgi:hypothetical protein